MPKRNTKQEILDASLKLFAERGYEGVTVRDIAGEVGIRESALYKHFTGKQSIFDTLLKKMEEHYNNAVVSFCIPQGESPLLASQYSAIGKDTLKQLCRSLFLFYLKDEYASRFRRMLSMEQFRSTAAGEAFRGLFIRDVLAYQSALFGEMILNRYFRSANPQIMALHFYSPIFLLLSRYDGQPDKEEEALQLLDLHIDQFELIYRQKA